ncbi:hypothetical protein CQA48_30095, partial [Klebsiella pneumoniae]
LVPGRRAGAFGVRWVENCVRSADTVPAGSTSANSPAQGVRPEPLRLFFCPRSWVLSASGTRTPRRGVRRPLGGKLRAFCRHGACWVDFR